MKAPITDKHLLELMWERFPEIMKRGAEHPAQRQRSVKPLTDEEISSMMSKNLRSPEGTYFSFARDIEAAHGITAAPQLKENA
jgi:hypothetical protein